MYVDNDGDDVNNVDDNSIKGKDEKLPVVIN